MKRFSFCVIGRGIYANNIKNTFGMNLNMGNSVCKSFYSGFTMVDFEMLKTSFY